MSPENQYVPRVEHERSPERRAWANYEAASDVVTKANGSLKRARKRLDAAVRARDEAHAIWMGIRKSSGAK